MRRLCLAFVLLTAACSRDSPAGPTPTDVERVLAPGQSTYVGSGARLSFLAVLQDSRCPINAVCVTAGEAVIRVAVTTPAMTVEREMRTSSKQPTLIDRVSIELIELQPYPFAGRPTPSSDYRATLKATRQ